MTATPPARLCSYALSVERIADRATNGRTKTRTDIKLEESLGVSAIEEAPGRKRAFVNRCITSRCIFSWPKPPIVALNAAFTADCRFRRSLGADKRYGVVAVRAGGVGA